MNITATLFGQMITFVIFVWFIKAYLWEPLTSAMDERTNKIADGLASAELGEKRIDEANVEYSRIVDEAKSKASDVITMANQQSSNIIKSTNWARFKYCQRCTKKRYLSDCNFLCRKNN